MSIKISCDHSYYNSNWCTYKNNIINNNNTNVVNNYDDENYRNVNNTCSSNHARRRNVANKRLRPLESLRNNNVQKQSDITIVSSSLLSPTLLPTSTSTMTSSQQSSIAIRRTVATATPTTIRGSIATNVDKQQQTTAADDCYCQRFCDDRLIIVPQSAPSSSSSHSWHNLRYYSSFLHFIVSAANKVKLLKSNVGGSISERTINSNNSSSRSNNNNTDNNSNENYQICDDNNNGRRRQQQQQQQRQQKRRRENIKCVKWKLIAQLINLFLWIILLNELNKTILPVQMLLIAADSTFVDLSNINSNLDSHIIAPRSSSAASSSSLTAGIGSNSYLDKLHANLERSSGVLDHLKIGGSTTSTTKRSLPPDSNGFISSLTTIATPPLTTLKYLEKSPHQQQINLHHRSYELDLERDHALPTSAPNADILKSNSNPTYPNPNRHHSHDRDRHRHILNTTPAPSLPNILKTNGGQPTIPMFSGGDMPSYSPPARSFFTPPLPPGYQNPFADKPTLRGTNNEGVIANTGTYINRRPIPPPSLMPGHQRIPYRPSDLNLSGVGNNPINPISGGGGGGGSLIQQNQSPSSEVLGGGSSSSSNSGGGSGAGIGSGGKQPLVHSSLLDQDGQRKKALNTPMQKIKGNGVSNNGGNGISGGANGGVSNIGVNSYDGAVLPIGTAAGSSSNGNSLSQNTSPNSRHEHLPSIRRILSGSNGNKGEIPDVLLKQVTSRPNYHLPPSSPVVIVQQSNGGGGGSGGIPGESGGTGGTGGITTSNGSNDAGDPASPNINQSKSSSSGGVGGGSETELDSSDSTGSDIEGKTHHHHHQQHHQKNKVSLKPTESPPLAAAPGSNGNDIYSTNINSGISSTQTETVAVGGGVGVIPSSSTVTSSAGVGGAQPNKIGIGIGTGAAATTAGATSAAAAAAATWTVAWNIHVYLSVILFTILAVYSIFKMIFYNKLTHLFSQSYFICIHLILITICMARIFYLCYDAYNIHSTFNIFISEILLNLPATFLTISFSVLILFLFIKSLNHKNNRYSALIRPLTVIVGCGVHVVLCITLHYVESYTTNHNHYYYQQQQQQQHQYQQQQQLYRRNGGGPISAATATSSASVSVSSQQQQQQLYQIPPQPPRVLSLICQIIYIFICLSLGLLYLYIYRILKRILRSKSQNYIHGFQNLSYAIHITIATALLFVLLAALQIFGAISISTTRPLITSASEIDWLQWGYQFSLRLIEIAIITLLSWVAGLKTSGSGGGGGGGGGIGSGGGGGGSTGHHHHHHHGGGGGGGGNSSGGGAGGHREKLADSHNVTGFFLPCTSSSSQEQFETDYPAVCNANTNLHTYTLRTGKLIYDDTFALNSLNGQSGGGGRGGGGGGGGDFQLQPQNNFIRPYDTGSLQSSEHHHNHHQHQHSQHQQPPPPQPPHHHNPLHHQHQHHQQQQDYLMSSDAQTDHYENPNFELRSTGGGSSSNKPPGSTSSTSSHQMMMLINDNCYSEPLNGSGGGYDFSNFERPKFSGSGNDPMMMIERPMSRSGGGGGGGVDKLNKHYTKSSNLDRSNYENPERRSANSTHSCASVRYPSYNSFERCGSSGGGGSGVGGGGANNGVRKSGTLNNIGGVVHGRNGSSSSSSSTSRPSGVQTLSTSAHNQHSRVAGGGGGVNNSGRMMRNNHHRTGERGGGGGGVGGSSGAAVGLSGINNGEDHSDVAFGRSSLERGSSKTIQQYILQQQQQQQQQQQHHHHFQQHHQHQLQQFQNQQQQQLSDDDMVIGSNAERANLINNGSFSGLTSSASGGNLTDNGISLGSGSMSGGGGGGGCGGVNGLSTTAINNTHHHSTSPSTHGSGKSNGVGGGGVGGGNGSSGLGSSSGESANSGSVLVAEHGFVRFRPLDDINNAQGVGIHNASIRNAGGSIGVSSSIIEKQQQQQRAYTNNNT